MKPSSILAVIPSLSASRLHQIKVLIGVLRTHSIETVVVANGRKLDNAMEMAGIPRLTPRENLGFGAAVNLAADSTVGWDWLLIVNDDVELESAKFEKTIGAYLTGVQVPQVVYLDEGPAKLLPTPAGVFTSLAMIAGIAKNLRRFTRLSKRTDFAEAYKSFSVVAISRSAWVKNGGFDERFAFTYEDSDFVRRGLQLDIEFISAYETGVAHLHSVTGRAHIGHVLPVSAWCGYQYLTKWGLNSALAKAVCLTALILRIPLIPFVHASHGQHLLGIGRAIRSIVRDESPSLPDYESV